jgi:hypothetical protein
MADPLSLKHRNEWRQRGECQTRRRIGRVTASVLWCTEVYMAGYVLRQTLDHRQNLSALMIHYWETIRGESFEVNTEFEKRRDEKGAGKESMVCKSWGAAKRTWIPDERKNADLPEPSLQLRKLVRGQ